jgi:hypothetical protein
MTDPATTISETAESVRRMRRAAVAAFAWAVLFGLISFYWAAGGTHGVGTLSHSIQEMAERREPGFVASVWLTGIAKVLGGLVPLALAFDWGRIVPRRALAWLCWIGGTLLVLYGLGDMVRAALVIGGIVEPSEPADRDIARWYLVLWGPVWVVVGACFLATAWHHRHAFASL